MCMGFFSIQQHSKICFRIFNAKLMRITQQHSTPTSTSILPVPEHDSMPFIGGGGGQTTIQPHHLPPTT